MKKVKEEEKIDNLSEAKSYTQEEAVGKLAKGTLVLAVIQHWHTKGERFAMLRYVEEDDCRWRTADDNSELSYDWNVIKIILVKDLDKKAEDNPYSMR